MTGQQHVVAGATLSAFSVCMYHDMIHTWTDESAINAMESVRNFIVPEQIWLIPVCVVFLFLGYLIPDCDSKNSLIGRYIYIPIEHRTWTHTIWFVILLSLPGLFFKPFYFLGYGIFLHLFCDAFSKCGVCWFFPRYKHYGYAKVKKGHFIYLYDSEPMGWILCGVMVTLTIIYTLGVFSLIQPLREGITAFDSVIESIVGFFVSIFG